MKSSEPPLSYQKLNVCFLRLRVGDRAFMVGSLDSNKMIFGIEES